ncbi:PIG-L deacetylase family protein [Curtobacterium ammoniigenes]|uniref:PIG-L deacetylase family protein n=1 Tax=Curtobacterium ammoniigenes TaxID=395387 RepID=UPI000833B766|nr:PIG-L family deacetylase [Curtobacterium ammoniigenes]
MTQPTPAAAAPSLRALVVAPHPDDAELGCPALIEATEADILVLCGSSPERVAEAKNAAQSLSRGALRILRYQDGSLQPTQDLIRSLDALLPGYDIVAGPPQLDSHQDHRATAQALRSAVRRSATTLLEYETPSTLAEWAPTAYLPIDAGHVERWTASAREHVSQSGASYFDVEYRLSRARVHGYAVGHDNAEAYRVVRTDARLLLGTEERTWSPVRTPVVRPRVAR